MAFTRAIVLGLDGFEPKIVEPLLQAGELPNLARIREQGGYSRVQTTYPALTPAAWSTFATGTNPGGHGIFEFVHRDPKTHLPTHALNRYEQKSAFLPPKAVNLRRGTPIWELLSKAGIPSTIVRCPCTYPPDPIHGRMLAGVGVPDIRGGLGTSTFYSSAEQVTEAESETVVRVRVDANRAVSTRLVGPRDPRSRADFGTDVTLHLEPAANRVVLRSDGQPKSLTIRQGEWSDWLRVKFKTGPLQSVRGILRFYLVQLEPVFELYASPVNFDPDSPMFPISSPPEYARELSAKLGTFYTTGMPEDHNGIINGRFGEEAFLDQCGGVLREREAMLRYELDRFKDGLLFCLFDTPDRIQHVLWRFREPDHPANDGDESPQMAAAIEDHYRACDRVVGEALRAADAQTLLVVLSDHGMSSFRRGIHLNTWLHQQGLLALKQGVRPGPATGDFLRGVDWERTRAYALGLGGIYLNLRGREAQGTVSPDEAEGLKQAIVSALSGLADPDRGAVAVRGVSRREEIYSGPYLDQAPDLLMNCAEGYRASWATPLGGFGEGLFEDNRKKWGGDHAVDPPLVPGVLFMNRPMQPQGARLVDLAPTLLAALGAPRGPAMEGGSLLR